MLIWAFMGRWTRKQSNNGWFSCCVETHTHISRQRNCQGLNPMPFSATTKRFSFYKISEAWHPTMARSYEEPWFYYHVPPSCHFISVMTHRLSIYTTNCIESGWGPSQSQTGPAVHLGKRRWLNWLGRVRCISVSPPWQTGCCLLVAHLTRFPPFLPCLPQVWEKAGWCASPRFGTFSPTRYVAERCGWLRAWATDGLGNVG